MTNEIMCPRCQETRLVDTVKDARGAQYFCQVCAYSWWPITSKSVTATEKRVG